MAGLFFAFDVVVFLTAVDFEGLTPAALAFAAALLFSLAALFLCITPFLAALSTWLCTELCAFDEGLLEKAFIASFNFRLVLLLRTAALLETRTLFLADLIIGIQNP